MILRLFKALILLAGLATGPALAQASVCAALPETGRVGKAGTAVIKPPIPNADRTLRCPDDFRLEAFARPPRCIGTGVKAEDGSPRAACYAGLPLGPLAPLPPRSRPTRSCGKSKSVTIVRLSGINVGLADAALSIRPPDGVTATTLTAIGGEVPLAEDPVVQGCFGFDCRLVRLEITAKAAPAVRVEVALPGGARVDEVLKLPEYCPK